MTVSGKEIALRQRLRVKRTKKEWKAKQQKEKNHNRCNKVERLDNNQ